MNFSLIRNTFTLLCDSATISTSFRQTKLWSSYFSVTRNKLGQSDKEISKFQGVPKPEPIDVKHCRRDIRMQPKKMLAMANLVKKMPIEEAIAQAQFSHKKSGLVAKKVLEEARDLAVNKYGIEDKTNLYVHHSTVGRGQHLKRIKYHGRGRFGRMSLYYCHYFVVLREGTPRGKNISRTNGRYLNELQRKLLHPKTIKHSLAWW